MDKITVNEKAYAKLNLSLDVLGRDGSGYHNMISVMQAISLSDDVRLTVVHGSGKISVRTNLPYVSGNRNNLAYRAAEAFMRHTGLKNRDINITIDKHIPVSSGMGGGSADSAAVLRAMNRAFATDLSTESLARISENVDSDSAFCVGCGTAIATGRGIKIEYISPVDFCAFTVLKPNFSISTQEMFSKIDSVKIRTHPDTEGLVRAAENRNLRELACRCYNVFESVLPRNEAERIESARNFLLTHGALCAAMTGSGSAVFGIFESFEQAEKAANDAAPNYEAAFAALPIGRL